MAEVVAHGCKFCGDPTETGQTYCDWRCRVARKTWTVYWRAALTEYFRLLIKDGRYNPPDTSEVATSLETASAHTTKGQPLCPTF